MKRPEPDTAAARRRSKEAADWLIRRDRGLSAQEQDAFLQWLGSHPMHGEWYALHRTMVGNFSALVDWCPAFSDEPNPDLLAPHRKRPRLATWSIAAAAAAALVLASLVLQRSLTKSQPFPTTTIDKRLLLADGTTVEVSGGAMVSFDFGTQWRRATLANGEAFFRVAHDPNRPFIVNAQGVDVRAVGTAFAVRVDGGAVNVVVTEGKVAVSRPLSDPLPHAAPVNEAQLLAGQRATIALRQTSPVIVSDARSREIAHQTDWQPLLLDFSSAPLAVAIKELNRRNSVQFVLADESLAALPIIASIRSDNVEGFAEFLSSAPGVVVERTNTFEMIIRRRP